MQLAAARFDIVILGGGISGLCQARDLARTGKRVAILEPFPHLGGNHKSWESDGLTFDIGAFFFTRGGPFLDTFAEVAGRLIDVQPRFGRLNPKGRLLTYPIKPRELRADLSLLDLALLPLDLLVSRLRHRHQSSAGQFARYYLGNIIYSRTGLKGYIERFFSSDDENVEVDFARKRMRWIADAASVRARFRRSRVRRVESGKVQAAVRPREGFAEFYDEIGRHLRQDGIEIETGARLETLTRTADGFRLVANGRPIEACRVISTIPMEDTARLLRLPDVKAPRSLDLLTLYARAPERLRTDRDVLFNFTAEGRWKRMTLHSRFYPSGAGDHMSIEITSRDGAAERPEEHLRTASAQLREAGLIDGELVMLGHQVTGNAYPLHTQGVTAAAEALRARIIACGVELAGRQGNFDYIPSADLAVRLVRAAAAPEPAPVTAEIPEPVPPPPIAAIPASSATIEPSLASTIS